MRRRRGGRLSTFGIGLVTLLVLLAICYLGFTKSIPFRHHFQIEAEFRTANNITKNSPVRIAA